MLRSSNAITKEAPPPAWGLGQPSPDPGMSASVELLGGDSPRLIDLLGVGKALPGEGLVAEEPPPAFLQVEPTGSGWDEDVVQARMRLQPGARLQTVMTRQIIRDQVEVPLGIV